MTTDDTGTRSEAMVLAMLLRAGYAVLAPYNVSRYDLALDESGRLSRVQVKTGRLRDGVIIFNTYSLPGGRGEKRYYTSEEIDYFAVYTPELDKVHLVPVDDVGKSGSLRIEAPRNNQTIGVRWAESYEVKPS